MNRRSDPVADSGTPRLHALDAIRSWPEESRRPASWLIHVHQEPDQVSEDQLVWENVEPWLRIVATRTFETREWPAPHTASVRGTIRYDVPAERRGAVEEFDLALEIDDERGVVEVVGPDLGTNLLALNLMHDVITGAVLPGEARRRYASLTATAPNGHPPADMLKCRFGDLIPAEPAPVPPSDHAPHTTQQMARPDAAPSTAPALRGVHKAMPTSPAPSDPTSERDTDRVAERRMTRRHGDDVDEAAERSSGFDLDA